MVNQIIEVLYGIALTLPLLWSMLCLLKLVIESKRKDKRGMFALKLIASFILSLLAMFVIFLMANRFCNINIKMPNWLNILGIFIFMLYYGVFGGFMLGLFGLGNVGVTPNKVIRELYNDVFKRRNRG
jgi:hypothetical protein